MIASVVVPAHNEVTVIDRCLAPLAQVGGARIVVAANGCTDATADLARRHGVTVLELSRSSKVAALNAGDSAAGDVMPRVYLDADIELDRRSFERLVDFLASRDEPTVAMPELVWDLSESSWWVRGFFRVYERLPYLSDGLVGAGCYAVNGSGRARWEAFPDITADDLFIQGLFTPDERVCVPGSRCTARAPRTLDGLLKVRTRTYAGNREAAESGLAGEMTDSTSRSIAALKRLVLRRPWAVLDAVVYVAINLVARSRAKRMTAGAPWLTDSSSR